MSTRPILYDLAPSPNNLKVRITLGYKGIPYEKVPVDGNDRRPVIEVSGQPFTPVLVHDGRVVFDSGAIIRYLDANWRDTPRIFSTDYQTMREIEDWEWWARGELAEPVLSMVRLFFSGKEDEDAIHRANTQFEERCARIERRLADRPFLMGDRIDATDLTAAPFAFYGFVTEKAAKAWPVAAFFAKNLRPREEFPLSRAWVSTLMAYDRMPG
ncbi:MAG: glutathione S-transferase family protein [Planctomycetes bacterium]|nr:glutathione S-transferase family protein [Planctomycetota bacterium]